MSEFKFVPVTALGGDQPRIDRIAGLTLTENPDIALASMAARTGQSAVVADAAKTKLGVTLPGVSKVSSDAPISAFWIGSDQWMLVAPHATHELLADQVTSQLGDLVSVTEQNDAWVCFELVGDLTTATFERLCAVDINAMSSGMVARTAIEHLGCFLLCLTEGQSYRVFGPRSSAASLHHALLTAARSVA